MHVHACIYVHVWRLYLRSIVSPEHFVSDELSAFTKPTYRAFRGLQAYTTSIQAHHNKGVNEVHVVATQLQILSKQ